MGRLRRRRDERGASAVEFGLVLIPLLYLIFGLVQYGWYFYRSVGNRWQHSARWL